MKNKFSLATLVAMGLLIVSCTTDAEEITTTSQKNGGVDLKIADSIIKTPPTTYADENGIIPPIKP